MALSTEDAAYVPTRFCIDVDRPLMVQGSRPDPWKDPLGVIDAYRLVKEDLAKAQLALVGSMASDDPEGWDYYNATVAHAAGEPDIRTLNNFNNVCWTPAAGQPDGASPDGASAPSGSPFPSGGAA